MGTWTQDGVKKLLAATVAEHVGDWLYRRLLMHNGASSPLVARSSEPQGNNRAQGEEEEEDETATPGAEDSLPYVVRAGRSAPVH